MTIPSSFRCAKHREAPTTTSDAAMVPVAERIQKVLANAGVGSRREVERWVAEGRITIDGRRAALGDQLQGRERVCLDGRPVRYKVNPGRREQSYLAYHKPSDPKHAASTEAGAESFDLPRPKRGRWVAVGVVDPGTSGLVVLTTDGELADRLSRPSAALERQYAVRFLGEPSDDELQRLLSGVELDDGALAKVDLIDAAGGTGNNVWYHLTVRGPHRRLRPLFDAVGVVVSRVMLLRCGPVELGRLRRGDRRELTAAEIQALYVAAQLEDHAAPPGRADTRASKSGQRERADASRKGRATARQERRKSASRRPRQ